ncbi:signal peptidase II [Leptospirillum ferriphilum]|uniref:signal peptidase II n=1 Tax=Leptospirillum ferriphilum TaxID=178606 RepID=UPI00098496A9|nr:signal peptidase II [Leptospirillum ferriphilum]
MISNISSKTVPSPRWTLYFTFVFLVFVIDQGTKKIIQGRLLEGESLTVIPHFFHVVSVRNTGIVFGLFQDPNGWVHRLIFIVLTIAAIGLILYYSHRRKRECGLEFYPLSIILGGALGNLSDRILKGRVVDFLDFSFHGHHWPAFNVADSAIVVGVLFLLLIQFSAQTDPNSSSHDSSP